MPIELLRAPFPAAILAALVALAGASCSSTPRTSTTTPQPKAPSSGHSEASEVAEVRSDAHDPRGGAPGSDAVSAGARPAILAAETFDAVWTTVRDQHFDRSLNGVDWDAVRVELRPRIEAAATQDEARAVLLDMLSRLGQSHFTIIPSEIAERSPVVATPEEQTEPPAERPARTSPGRTRDDGGDQPMLAGVEATIETSTESTLETTTETATESESDADTDAEAAPGTSRRRGPGVSGLDVAIVDGVPTVLRVAPGLPAERAGIEPGWRLVSVDGVDLGQSLAPIDAELAHEPDPASPHARQLRAERASIAGSLLSREAGTRAFLVLEDAAGTRHESDLAFETAPLGSTQFGNLPPFPIAVESRLVERRAPAGRDFRIGVIAFNIWMTAAMPAIDRAIDDFRRSDGIVIDLRGNPGGVGAMSMGVAGHFLQEPASLGSMIGRDTTLEFRATPRRVSTENKRVRPYSKPLAILVDGRSASTSEVFAAGLQGLGRARVFGETSAGMALPAHAVELPSGDVLLHAIADFTTPTGARIEGRGVVPDESAVPTRAGLSEGRDAALEAAIAWIADSTMAARSARSAAPDASAATAPTPAPAAAAP